MDKYYNPLISYISEHQDNIFYAFLVWFFSYFAEIRGSVTVMAVAFLFDLIFGIAKSKLITKEKFSAHKFWQQTFRFMIVLIIAFLLMAMDKENNQDVVSVYNGFTWLVTGFLIYSIAENGFALTKWDFFIILKSFIKKKTETITDIDITEKQPKTDQ